ncbi:uncharacterized protein LOC143918582 [Arctopsyche grandis]|uniref:uncharacterized protein LOC143918582 n=1 Tax=Arctopsyche grandis TaxID=121162 RepID=UPI00406D642C
MLGDMTSIALFILTMATMVTASNDLRPFQESKADLEPLPKQRADYAKYRLPGPTIPSYYAIVLRIDPNDPNKTFTGEVAIDMTTNTPVNKIILHSNVTVIYNITVMAKKSNVNLYDRHISATDDTYFLTIHLTQNLTVNQVYVININYVGMYGNNFHGVYLSSYTDANNTKRRLATTQFEPIYARNAFPCYDEPELKSVFQTNIYSPPGYHAVCNTDQTTTTTLPPMQGGFSLFAFEPTVRMSSYLNAFTISDFIYKSNLDRPSQVFPKKFRILSKPNTEPYMDFALDFGEKSISCMEKYTNITYALKKLDNIAIPDKGGAMENWEKKYCLIFLELHLRQRSSQSLQRCPTKLATCGLGMGPAWWNYLWLSEGFATYFEYYVTQEVAPEWRTMDQYVEVVHHAMKIDTEESSNPMTSSVASPQEVIKNSNPIAYKKSGSVIRMMEHILGTAVFKQGLQNYLKSIPLGLAEPQKLFDGLQAAANGKKILPDDLTVTDIFGIWSTQPGYPLVTATSADNGSINLSSINRRFFRISENITTEETDYIPWLTVLPGIKKLRLMMPAATYFNIYIGYLSFLIRSIDGNPKFGFFALIKCTYIYEFLLQIIDKVYQSIGFEPKPYDDYITRMKRNLILDIACNAGNNDCRKNSNKKLELLTQNYNTTIDPDVKDSVYCSGLRDATKDLWEFFWNKYINATSNFQKITILRYLACSEDVAILQDYLMLTVTNNSGLFYNYHRYIVVKSVINAGHVGVDQAVKFIMTNFTAIKSIMPKHTVIIINYIKNRVVTKENVDQFNEFAKTEDFTKNEQESVIAAQSEIATNKAWLDIILPDIDPWLLENKIETLMDRGNCAVKVVLYKELHMVDQLILERAMVPCGPLGSLNKCYEANLCRSSSKANMAPIAILILALATLASASDDLWPVLRRDTNLDPLPLHRADYAKYRLPGPTIPSQYTIILKVDPNNPNNTFDGEVAIDITTNTPVDRIILHSNVKTINSITVMAKESTVNLYDRHTSATDDTNFLTILLTQNLSVNQVYVININYVGMYGENLEGLYLSSYIDANNTERRLATTQFEAVSARDAFPCYDEPGLKSVFQINIYTPPGYHAICNTDQSNVTTLPPMQDGLSLHTFEPTVRMSSYLIAFVISDFVYKSNINRPPQVFRKKFRVFGKPNTEDYMDFALDFGEKSINNLEKYTNVTYALSKLDNFAIPDFSAGAMENWGLITYREQYLLDIPGVTSTRDKQFIATIMSHENGHMWFGNEVSPAWWDYLWLSEGFATYFESYTTQEVAPEWRTMDQYVMGSIHRAMLADSVESANPMTASVASPREISNNFNRIAYEKSGSVIRMMEHILGTAVFRQGLQNYLKSNPLGLAEPQKLFDGLQAAADGKNILPDDLTVTDIFGIWSTQPGYPLVTATGGNNGSINLTQTRFYQTNITSSEKWWIPITWVTSKGGDFQNTLVQRWFSPNDTVLNIPLELDEDSWFILNKQETGYYRVTYDNKNWKLLASALKAQNFSGIHLLNRAQLIDDSLELARTLRLNYATTFDLLFHLKEEVDFIPWLTVLPGINTLNLVMPAATNFNKYREFLRQISDKVYKNVGFEPKPNDDYVTKMNRNIILNIACNAGNVNCKENSNKKLEQLTQNYNMTIDPDVRASVYCSGIRDATNDLWKFFWSKYINATSNSEKVTILTYLACSEDIEILQDYLMLTVENNSGLFDNRHRYTVLQSVINAGYVGVDQAVKFITTNFAAIKSIMPEYTVTLINYIRSRIVTKENVDQFNEFAQTGDFTINESAAVAAAQSVIASNRAWLDRVLPDIDSWLLENVESSTTISNISE